ncbi:MAG: hypothetical protein HW386_719 [Gammaproteobacteria bacterium]|nr:hypothetical protein [Gammaproteobacteria bacterium]
MRARLCRERCFPGFDGQESECRECMDAHERPLRCIRATISLTSVLRQRFQSGVGEDQPFTPRAFEIDLHPGIAALTFQI